MDIQSCANVLLAGASFLGIKISIFRCCFAPPSVRNPEGHFSRIFPPPAGKFSQLSSDSSYFYSVWGKLKQFWSIWVSFHQVMRDKNARISWPQERGQKTHTHTQLFCGVKMSSVFFLVSTNLFLASRSRKTSGSHKRMSLSQQRHLVSNW